MRREHYPHQTYRRSGRARHRRARVRYRRLRATDRTGPRHAGRLLLAVVLPLLLACGTGAAVHRRVAAPPPARPDTASAAAPAPVPQAPEASVLPGPGTKRPGSAPASRVLASPVAPPRAGSGRPGPTTAAGTPSPTGTTSEATPATAEPSPEPTTTRTTGTAPTTAPTTDPGPTASPTPPVAGTVPRGIPGNWHLTFDDEFTGTALNPVWCPGWFGRGSSGPVNSEENGPYDSRNVTVRGGSLRLTETGHTGALVSTNPADGCHGSNPGFAFRYGVIEFRAWLPPGPHGLADWPALWTDGQHWPQDGEIDVMEGLDGTAATHYHYGSGENDWHPDNGTTVDGDWAGGWHTFAVDREPGSVTTYYDGHRVWHTTQGVVDTPMYPILDYTVHSGNTALPGTMKIDYVRVWT